MTFTIKTETINDLQITMYQEKYSTAYHVALYRIFDSGLAKTLNDNIYATRKQANARFYRLKTNVKNGDY